MNMQRLEALYAAYFPSMLPYVRQKLRQNLLSADLAEDIINDSFIELLVNWEEHADKTDNMIQRWLFITVRNKIRELHRNERECENIEDHIRTISDNGGIREIEDTLFQEELLAAMKKDLSENEYRILELIIREGKSYDEMAAVLGIPAATIGVILHRLRIRLKEAEKHKKIRIFFEKLK